MNLSLTWAMLRGGGRREVSRAVLTIAGTAFVVVFALAAATVLRIDVGTYEDPSVFGPYTVTRPIPHYTSNLLNESGLRPGVAFACALLTLPALAFLGQCARIGVVRRHRRLAALRLAGATPGQARLFAATESGLHAIIGTASGAGLFVLLRFGLERLNRPGRALTWPTDVAPAPVFVVAILTVTPLVVTSVAAFALRGVVTTPLGVLRRQRPARPLGRWPMWPAIALGLGSALIAAPVALHIRGVMAFTLLSGLGTMCLGACVMGGTGPLSVALGRLLLRVARGPAAVLAARRLLADPWANARANGAVLLCVMLTGIAETVRWNTLARPLDDPRFYIDAHNLVDVALGVAVTVAAAGLVVGLVESITDNRRSLAAQIACGVPVKVLRRTVLLQSAVPTVPAILAAAALGASGLRMSGAGRGSVVVLVPLAIAGFAIAVCLLATVAALPFLHRAVRPAELRHE